MCPQIAENALHDASERSPPPNCHPGTREEILHIIRAWVGESNSETDLFWLSGNVGTGKFAVMQSIAGKGPDSHTIVASFFFGRGKSSMGRYLFPTVAFQLAINVAELCGPINRIMRADPLLLTRSIETQFQSLIVNPCQEQYITPRVIIIDDVKTMGFSS